ncbi:MAG: metallophosphoesterase [Sporolactobacillus sp.]
MILFIILLAVLLAAILLFVYMYREAFLDRMVPMDLSVQLLADTFDGMKLFFISDIHRRKVSPRLLEKLPSSPDYVIIGGDLTERGVPLLRVRENLRRLTRLAPVYFVWGNHDWEAGKEQVQALLLDCGVHILDNETVVLRREGQALNLTGVNDATRDHDNIKKALAEREVNAPTLLFSHNPKIKRKLLPQMKIAYAICGHTHGGQVNLLGYTVKEKGGVKVHAFGTLIISNGYGTTKLPIRLAAKPDALFLTLRKK